MQARRSGTTRSPSRIASPRRRRCARSSRSRGSSRRFVSPRFRSPRPRRRSAVRRPCACPPRSGSPRRPACRPGRPPRPPLRMAGIEGLNPGLAAARPAPRPPGPPSGPAEPGPGLRGPSGGGPRLARPGDAGRGGTGQGAGKGDAKGTSGPRPHRRPSSPRARRLPIAHRPAPRRRRKGDREDVEPPATSPACPPRSKVAECIEGRSAPGYRAPHSSGRSAGIHIPKPFRLPHCGTGAVARAGREVTVRLSPGRPGFRAVGASGRVCV